MEFLLELTVDVLAWLFMRDNEEWSVGRIVAALAIVIAIVLFAWWYSYH
jgi:hypothetical protein